MENVFYIPDWVKMDRGPGAVLIGGIEVGDDVFIDALAQVSFALPARSIVSAPLGNVKRRLTANEDPSHRLRRRD